MQTPQRISVESFVAEEARFLAKSCIEYPDRAYELCPVRHAHQVGSGIHLHAPQS